MATPENTLDYPASRAGRSDKADPVGYPFAPVPRSLAHVLPHLKLSPTCWQVYHFLIFKAIGRPRARQSAVYLSSARIGRELGVDPSNVRKALRRLTTRRLLTVAWKGGSADCMIHVLWNPDLSADLPAKPGQDLLENPPDLTRWSGVNQPGYEPVDRKPVEGSLEPKHRNEAHGLKTLRGRARRPSMRYKPGSIEEWWLTVASRDLYPNELGCARRWRSECDYLEDSQIVSYCELRLQARLAAGDPIPKSLKWFDAAVRELNIDRADDDFRKVSLDDRFSWEPEPLDLPEQKEA